MRGIVLNYLVLGHTGFIGNAVVEHLTSHHQKVHVVESRLIPGGVRDIIEMNSDTKTVVINCVASGVTPNSGSPHTNSQTNVQLATEIVQGSLDNNVQGIIHFASHYEISKNIVVPESRSSYINTKIRASDFCKERIESGANLKLIYLPTIIGSKQPRGRLFRDFVECAMKEQVFFVKYPNTEIELQTVDSLLAGLDLLSDQFMGGVIQLQGEVKTTVKNYLIFLNSLMNELGFSRAVLENVPTGDEITEFSRQFRLECLDYIKRMTA